MSHRNATGALGRKYTCLTGVFGLVMSMACGSILTPVDSEKTKPAVTHPGAADTQSSKANAPARPPESPPARPPQSPPDRPPQSPPAMDTEPTPHVQPATGVRGALEAHNRVRALHCAAPLTWSEPLAADAQAWAERLRDEGCQMRHDTQTKQGENLAWFSPEGRMTAAATTEAWYAEVEAFDFDNPGFSRHTGHFTQVVWTDTTEVGCGVVSCNGGDLFVCRYNPSGNYRGQYDDKVLPKSCR